MLDYLRYEGREGDKIQYSDHKKKIKEVYDVFLLPPNYDIDSGLLSSYCPFSTQRSNG